ncbi:17018_t:CDS:2, partial [Dentiscutata heterogama]
MNLIIDEIRKGYLNEFNYNEFQIQKRISDGSSEVILAYMKTNHKHAVLKFLKCNQDEHEYCKKFRREQIFPNDNVISFYGITKDPLKKFHSIVLQYCFNKNLREHLKEKKFDWFYKNQMAKEIATGLGFIHAANIVHCDLNSKNIMHHNGKLVIIDFSSSMSSENQEEPILKITEENILWEISNSRPPFSDNFELYTNKLRDFLTRGGRETPVNLTPVDYKELYCDSWNSDPEKRPSINEVISRLSDIEFDCVYQDSDYIDYIPEISLGSSFRNITQFTSNKAACLEVIKGSALNLYIFLPPVEISVGRGNKNDIIIKDHKIAKKHARIIVNNQGQVEINEL